MNTTLEKFYALQIPEVRNLFIKAMQDIADESSINEMEKAIEENDIERLIQASGFNPVLLNGILDKIEEIYERAGNMFVDGWPKLRNSLGLVKPVFNIRNESVEKDLKNFSSNFITNITNEVRESIKETLADGMSRGLNPRETALNIVGRMDRKTHKRIGGTIGLASNQTRWVNNARLYLQNLDEKYFTLTLRDKRFDSIVRKAIEENKKLNKETISRLITAYESKALKYRGDAIARTEVLQSINRAERAAIEQNIEQGLITKDMVSKWWSTSADERVRRSHVNLGLRYNKSHAIGFDDPFETMTGNDLMYPGDVSLGAGPEEIIHCRCKCEYHIDFLKRWRQ
jgi:hypothetical protein